jgi:hypothetical protein
MENLRILTLLDCLPMKQIVLLILLIILFFNTACAQTAEKINKVGNEALAPENYIKRNDETFLYGIKTNGADTKNGQWACAKVATIILKKAGVVNRISLGVRHVETALTGWNKIKNKKDLKPGDVVVWLNRFTGRDDEKCTGGGNCHVGIVTDKGYFHNSPLSGAPTYGGISLWAFYFKMGYRLPD